MATALHADALDDLLHANDCCTGPHEATALLTNLYEDECKPPPGPELFIREGRAYFYACNDEEADYYEEPWAQHLRNLRQLFGDPGRH